MDALHDFIELVNQDETVRPFLKVFPFLPENIDLAIYNYTDKGYNVYDPFIGAVSAHKGKIGYLTFEENRLPIKSEKYETYGDAMAILHKE